MRFILPWMLQTNQLNLLHTATSGSLHSSSRFSSHVVNVCDVTLLSRARGDSRMRRRRKNIKNKNKTPTARVRGAVL